MAPFTAASTLGVNSIENTALWLPVRNTSRSFKAKETWFKFVFRASRLDFGQSLTVKQFLFRPLFRGFQSQELGLKNLESPHRLPLTLESREHFFTFFKPFHEAEAFAMPPHRTHEQSGP
jgi:hypothetical protein